LLVLPVTEPGAREAQDSQRIGASIGAAVLVTVYQLAGDASADTGLRAALLTGAALVSLALAMAVRSLRQQTAA